MAVKNKAQSTKVEKKSKVITKKITEKGKKMTKAANPIKSKKSVAANVETDYMNKKQLEHFRNILLERKKQLLEEMNRTVQDMQTEVNNFADPLDRAAQEEKFNLELKTRDRERKLVKKIDEALEKIVGEDYGYCVDCGAEIGLDRLEARPTATQCIECKTIAEIKEKQTGG